MAKNVSIIEDGNNKIIENATKIRTSLSGGGTCDWIPKDDVPLETLEVSEDGVYRPGENYYGFDKVIASGIGTVTMGDLIEKTVTKNGTYNIADESGNPYGYSKIIVNVDTSDDSGGDGGGGGGNTPVVGKDEDGNDTMAETDDDGNIVMTALPTEIKVIIPPTKLEYNRYEEIDYSGISVYAYISKAIHWLGTTTTVVTEGSSDNTVSIGGSNVTVSVGDGILYAPDRTGQNDVQLVWDGTKWIKPSNYSAEKAVWKSDKYPTGKIPFEELIFPIKRINNIESEKIVYTFDIDGILFKLVSVSSFSWSFDTYSAGEYLGRAFYTIYLRGSEYLGVIDMYDPYSRNSQVYVVSNTPNTKSIEYETTDYTSYSMDAIVHKTYPKVNYTTVHQISADNIYFAHNNRSCSVSIPVTNIPYGKTSNDILENVINKYNSDDYKKTELISIPVQWKRPGDGKILETTFTAWMKDDGSGTPDASQGGAD